MSNSFNLRAIISMTDRLSPVLNQQMRHMQQWRRQLNKMGAGAVPMAAGWVAAVTLPAKAFMELENATIGLQNTLADKNGLTNGLEKISAVASKLGADLPGTVSDFYKMATAMSSAGVNANTLANGGLKAAAYLGLVTKDIGGGYDAAANSVAKLSVAFKIADSDLVGFADTMARAVNLGVGFDDANYALAKTAGILGGMKLTGGNVAKDLLPAVAMMNQVGISGEQAGTGLAALFAWAAPKGAKSIPDIIHNLEKLYKMNPSKVIGQFNKDFGKEHGPKLLSLANGGYGPMRQRFDNQEELTKKAERSQKGLAAVLDAASGTFESAMAVYGKAYAPEMKNTANAFNKMAENMGAFFAANGKLIKVALEMSAALVGLKLAALAGAWGVGVLTKILSTNIWITLIQGLVLIAPMIYENWGKITEFIKTSFNGAIDFVTAKFKAFVDGIMLGVNGIKDAFIGVANIIRSAFNFSDDIKMPDLKMPYFKLPDISGFLPDMQPANGMRAPGSGSQNTTRSPLSDSRRRVIQSGSGQVSGGIRIDVNALPGTRVIPYPTQGPISILPSVGFRSLGMKGAN